MTVSNTRAKYFSTLVRINLARVLDTVGHYFPLYTEKEIPENLFVGYIKFARRKT